MELNPKQRRSLLPLVMLLFSRNPVRADLPYLSPEAAPKIAGQSSAEVPLGPFSEVPYRKQGWMWNLHFNVYVERGFKFHLVLPELHEGRFGRSTFAGFLTVVVNGNDAIFPCFKEPQDGTQIIECTGDHAVIAKDLDQPGYHVKTFIEMWVGQPFARFWAEVTPKGTPLTADYLLTGYGWAKLEAPEVWDVPLEGGAERRSLGNILKPGEKLASPSVRFGQGSGGGSFAFVFGAPPKAIRARGKEDVEIVWQDKPLSAGQTHRLPDLWYCLFPPGSSDQAVRELLQAMPPKPAPLIETRFGQDKDSWIEYAAKISKESTKPLLAIPPTLGSLTHASLRLPSFLGEVVYVRGERVRVRLPRPPHLDDLTVNFPKLSEERQKKTEGYVAELLSHQTKDGAFTFSVGRPFYDGLTISSLVQLHGVLRGDLRARNATAVRNCLDYWWGRLTYEPNYRFVYFPEPQPMLPQIDYPEISACLLYPTAAYAQLVDRSYARRIWPKAKQFLSSLPKGEGWTGSAYACPGPGWNHVLVESTIGGYLAWASLYHIARLAGAKESLPELQARAAFAWQSMQMLRYRPEYGPEGFFVEHWGDNVRACFGKEEWDYTMYTWFSFIPLFSLPSEDDFGVWGQLDKQKWWEFYKKSTQRTYDWADFIALARFRGRSEALKHLSSFEDQPFHYSTFDYTPAFTVVAYLWLAWAEASNP